MFKLEIENDFPERCDACNQIDPARPMLRVISKCPETGKVETWVHLDEFESKLARVKKQFELAKTEATHG